MCVPLDKVVSNCCQRNIRNRTECLPAEGNKDIFNIMTGRNIVVFMHRYFEWLAGVLCNQTRKVQKYPQLDAATKLARH